MSELIQIKSVLDAKVITGGGLSTATKMPCPVYSIPAIECKTGGKLAKVESSTCCEKTCYAKKVYGGWYMKSRVLEPMYRRFYSLKNKLWVQAMVFLINRKRLAYFRWHDSGDIQGIWHLDKIVQVAKLCPETKFWLPTREWAIVKKYITDLKQEIPKNLCIRLSAFMIDGPAPTDLANKLGVTTSRVSEKKFDCPASLQYNYCRACRKCWNNEVKNVTYHLH